VSKRGTAGTGQGQLPSDSDGIAAACRGTYMQSLPVSPPPITRTLFPLAERYSESSRFESRSDLVFFCRNSMAVAAEPER
jgi:hypothetical protein